MDGLGDDPIAMTVDATPCRGLELETTPRGIGRLLKSDGFERRRS
jgi:hypothetical protein